MKLPRLLRQELCQIVLLALPFAAVAACWNRIPPTVVTHWNLHNQPDGWMRKGPGLLLLPLVNVGLCLLFAGLARLDPRLRRDPAAGTARFRRLLRWCRYALTGFFAVLALALIAVAAGWTLDIGRLVCNGALALFAVLGNFLGNVPPNYFLGIRTPWTLEDPATWRATHRLGGRVMVFGSVALLAAGLCVSSVVLLGLLFAFLLGLAAWSLGYSAWFYGRRGGGAQLVG